MSPTPSCLPLVVWTVSAHRHLRQALAETMGRGQPQALATIMNDLTRRLRCLFPQARAIVVQDQYTGFRRREDEFILLVEIEDDQRPGRHVVKLARPERLAIELAAWESCRPYGLRQDLVFMTLEPGNPDGPLDGLVYGDAQQFLGDVPVVYLEAAFLNAVRHGSPSPAAVADTLVQLYERIGHLLYRQSFLDNPAAADFVLDLPRLAESFPEWSRPGSEPGRARQDVNTWAQAEAGCFRDPVDYLRFVCQCVPWRGEVPEGAAEPTVHRPEHPADAPAAHEVVPRMLRGCGHGDLHGRNVLVALVRERARWPAVFDYEHMGPANLLVWDFVKMETELKIRAFAALLSSERAESFIRSVQDFEIELAAQTEACHDGRPWPEVVDTAAPLERLRALLLTLRRQAALHLGIDAPRPSREWLDEYYFGLMAYGVQAGRFLNLERPHLMAACVSAGVACARFLWTREDHLAADRASATAPRAGAADVLRRPYPSYHRPLAIARDFLRDGNHQGEALALLAELRQRYKHVLAIGSEYVLALMENDRDTEAMTELGRLNRQFPEVDEETRCRWGSLYKRQGDRAWKGNDLVTAENRFVQALEEYRRAYALRHGHYPGINHATLLLFLAALSRQRRDVGRSLRYLHEAEEVAEDVLKRREQADGWRADLPDDNIWHPATAGEAHLIKRSWAEAAGQYTAALSASNLQPFHRQSIGRQARRILDALEQIELHPEPPFDNPDGIFGPPC